MDAGRGAMGQGARLVVMLVVTAAVLSASALPARAQSPAGTTISVHGQSTVIRNEPETTAPLHTRDPVFVRDRVGTAEKSVVRLLLGGKALVTLRESSVVTITDTPEHSTITLREGKLALGLAKSKLRPGDVVEVRTPNAVAGIRGSFLVAETVTVNGVVQTVFSSLHVSTPIVVTFTNNPNSTLLGVNQTLSVTGLGLGAVITPVRGLTADEIRRTAAVSSAPSLTNRDVAPPAGVTGGALATDPAAKPFTPPKIEIPRPFIIVPPSSPTSRPTNPAG